MTIETVLGAVDGSALGITLPHEHLLINLLPERRGDGLINDEALVIEELTIFTEQGGVTIVDLSSGALAHGTGSHPGPRSPHRDPSNVEALVRISRASGMNVILGTGHYRDPYLDANYVDTHSTDQIADDLVRDLDDAIPGTSVRAAVIGEVGSDGWYISAREERSLRASARASLRTGAGIYTHAARWAVAPAQLDVLFAEKVDPGRIAIGHVDTVDEAGYAVALAERGVYVGLDTMFSSLPKEIDKRVALLVELVDAGFADRVLLSHDVCVPSQLAAAGGPGYGLLLGEFASRALHAGIPSELLHEITTTNPAHFLARG